ncbi:MAG: hypothetical protein JNL08_21430 [Planctomycetes bacterium]|nr:hypothetical protein [Planctomycetota bacterium]
MSSLSLPGPCLWLVLAVPLTAQGNDLTAPLVALVAEPAVVTELEPLLRDAALRTRRVAPAACTAAALRLADVVVVVAWPESVPVDAHPLGDVDRWDRPTVFVGDSGERCARQWGLPTPAELTEFDSGARGPEAWTYAPPGEAKTEVLRQGHLFYFPAAVPAVLATPAERAWFAATVRLAARFVLDRPIVRHPTANQAPLPAAEVARRERIEAAAKQLAVDVDRAETVPTLIERLQERDHALAAALLDDLFVDGPIAQRTRNNWRSWWSARRAAMVWDPLSYVWRLDQLAYWRGVASATLSGDDRADGGEREPEAVALAVKVVQRYGGRALDDLATFTCWRGDVCCLWDRRAAIFRLENHATVPPGRFATQWDVSVLDTAGDRELIWGGGPPPQPRVSARADYRDLLTRLFLPALLLEPGTSLRRERQHDDGGRQCLVARLALRGADPKESLRLLVEPADGSIARVARWTDDRNQVASWTIDATQPCGPILVPIAGNLQERRRITRFEYAEPAWNPDLPADLATATDRRTQPREH